MNYAYTNNGMSSRSVETQYTAVAGEVLFDHAPCADELTEAFSGYAAAAAAQAAASANATVQAQINALSLQLQAPLAAYTVASAGGIADDMAKALSIITPINSQIAALQAQIVA